jgi:hypothetical protein
MKPFLTVSVHLARHRQTLSDQLVLGLVTGGLLGSGLVIEGREASCIRFARTPALLAKEFDRGEIHLDGDGAETVVECVVWGRGMSVRRGLIAALVGGGLATLAALGFDWLLSWSLPLGAACALLLDGALWAADRRRLRRQIVAYLKNTTYLKSL